MLRKGSSILWLVSMMAGCMVGPDYQPPNISSTDHWHVPLTQGLETAPKSASSWWRAFNDPMLDELIVLAQTQNKTLQVASLRIDIARAKYGIAASDLWPSVAGLGAASAHKHPTRRPFVSDIAPNNRYFAALDVSWEVDLWGRVRRGMQAANADVEQTLENWRDLLVTLRAEVATSYIAARTLQAQANVLRTAIDTRRQMVALLKEMKSSGAVTNLQLANAQAQLNILEAQMPEVETRIARTINRISVLISEQPGKLRERLAMPGTIPIPPSQIAVGIPADVIRQRPDIRAAERRIAIQTARIGVATANLLPRLSINGVLGFESDSFSGWMDGNNLSASLGPRLVWPIFNGMAILKDIEITDLRTEQATLAYEQTVLRAFEETENALIAYANAIKSQRQFGKSVVAYEEVLALSRQRYDAGVDDLQVLLDAQQLLLDAQGQWLDAQGKSASNVVALYKALGGDWELSPGPFPAGEQELEPHEKNKPTGRGSGHAP